MNIIKLLYARCCVTFTVTDRTSTRRSHVIEPMKERDNWRKCVYCMYNVMNMFILYSICVLCRTWMNRPKEFAWFVVFNKIRPVFYGPWIVYICVTDYVIVDERIHMFKRARKKLKQIVLGLLAINLLYVCRWMCEYVLKHPV